MALRRGSATPVMALQDARTCLYGETATELCSFSLLYAHVPRHSLFLIHFFAQYIIYLRWHGLDEYHRSACTLHHVGEPARYPAYLTLCH